jgi:ribosomal protein S18 acetylase RimI-like enzyme
MDSSISIRRAALLVAVAGGGVVGTVIAGWDGWRGNIYRLAVHPNHRRRGTGRALAAAADDVLAALGARASPRWSTATARGRWDSGTRSAVPATSGIRPWCAT